VIDQAVERGDQVANRLKPCTHQIDAVAVAALAIKGCASAPDVANPTDARSKERRLMVPMAVLLPYHRRTARSPRTPFIASTCQSY
jgi:hypothetical protein